MGEHNLPRFPRCRCTECTELARAYPADGIQLAMPFVNQRLLRRRRQSSTRASAATRQKEPA